MNGFIDLSVAAEDAELAGVLDWAHADPFDRLILGQAQRHAMSLITADAAVREFIAVAQIAATYSVGREGRRCRQTR